VCAPSLIPRKPGERVKTDRRDAIKLVRSLRAGDLSAVHVPTVEDEAFRDLARAWSAAREDLKAARCRLKSFLLSHGVHYLGRPDWGATHRRWLSTFSFDSAWQQLAFDEHRRTIEDRLAHATIAAARGLWSQAARELGPLREAAPRRPEVHFVAAFVALARGEWRAAVRAADAALALRPRYPEARLVRADALGRLGREDEVRRELDRFLAEAPPGMAAERARAERRLSARTSLLEIK